MGVVWKDVGKIQFLCYDQILSDNCGNKGSIRHLNACVKLLRLKKIINPTRASPPFPLYLMYFIFRKNSCQKYMSLFTSLQQLLLELWNYHSVLFIKCTTWLNCLSCTHIFVFKSLHSLMHHRTVWGGMKKRHQCFTISKLQNNLGLSHSRLIEISNLITAFNNRPVSFIKLIKHSRPGQRPGWFRPFKWEIRALHWIWLSVRHFSVNILPFLKFQTRPCTSVIHLYKAT